MFRMFIAVVASLATTAAHSQAPGISDPADARAAVPALRYDSALAGYRTARDSKPVPWRALNDEVAAIGGHAGHVKSLGKDSTPSAKPVPSPLPQPQPQPQPQLRHNH